MVRLDLLSLLKRYAGFDMNDRYSSLAFSFLAAARHCAFPRELNEWEHIVRVRFSRLFAFASLCPS